MNDLISVIVPVYNFQDCLKRCVDSILEQTYINLELILVDDGSQDESGNICDQYKASDHRVKVLHKKNGGTSEARNYGLELAAGDYISFVDGDDFIEPDFYESLYNLITKYNKDIAMVSYQQVKKDRIIPQATSGKVAVIDREMAVQELLLDNTIQNYVWNKLYKRELFKTIRFPVGVVYDDINIMYELFRESNGVVYQETVKYNYCIRDTGVIKTNSHKKREDALLSIEKRFNDVEVDFPSLHKYNAFAYVLWMIRIYTFTVRENGYDYEFIRKRLPLLQKLYEENKLLLINQLKPKKRIVLFVMLWDIDKGKEILECIDSIK